MTRRRLFQHLVAAMLWTRAVAKATRVALTAAPSRHRSIFETIDKRIWDQYRAGLLGPSLGFDWMTWTEPGQARPLGPNSFPPAIQDRPCVFHFSPASLSDRPPVARNAAAWLGSLASTPNALDKKEEPTACATKS